MSKEEELTLSEQWPLSLCTEKNLKDCVTFMKKSYNAYLTKSKKDKHILSNLRLLDLWASAQKG